MPAVSASSILPLPAPHLRAVGRALLVQGIAGVAWWVLLLTVPDARAWFFPAPSIDHLLVPLLLPDVCVFVLGSFIAAWICLASATRRASRTLPADTPLSLAPIVSVSLVAGATVYATLLTLGLCIHAARHGHAKAGEEGLLGLTIMCGAAAMNLACIALIARARFIATQLFRAAPPRTPAHLALRTALQAAIFWGLFLFLIPALLAHLENRIALAHTFPIPRLSIGPSPWPHIVGALVFALGSSLGVASAWVMVRFGLGTPLPIEAARRLVIAGPYRIVRNPMAVAGLTQGLGVAIWLESWTVVAYVLMGGLMWDAIVRPVEEADLHARFGDDYNRYRQRVRCWLPIPSARSLATPSPHPPHRSETP